MYPPTVFTTPITNKRYMVDGEHWIEVPPHTTVQDAEKLHRQMFPDYYNRPMPPHVVKTVKAKSSSRENLYYDVKTWSDGSKTCSCGGFKWHKSCKHTKA